eukprot:15862782-Heterocapsa_arctica.AAC.1
MIVQEFIEDARDAPRRLDPNAVTDGVATGVPGPCGFQPDGFGGLVLIFPEIPRRFELPEYHV